MCAKVILLVVDGGILDIMLYLPVPPFARKAAAADGGTVVVVVSTDIRVASCFPPPVFMSALPSKIQTTASALKRFSEHLNFSTA